jgi:hypothetical protein
MYDNRTHLSCTPPCSIRDPKSTPVPFLYSPITAAGGPNLDARGAQYTDSIALATRLLIGPDIACPLTRRRGNNGLLGFTWIPDS